jgi:hypothetical protein
LEGKAVDLGYSNILIMHTQSLLAQSLAILWNLINWHGLNAEKYASLD